jgi:hypothetical protein
MRVRHGIFRLYSSNSQLFGGRWNSGGEKPSHCNSTPLTNRTAGVRRTEPKCGK